MDLFRKQASDVFPCAWGVEDKYFRTKDKAEHGVYAAESAPEEYAADRVSGGVETAAYEAAHQLDKR